jgi:hypothetical protein
MGREQPMRQRLGRGLIASQFALSCIAAPCPAHFALRSAGRAERGYESAASTEPDQQAQAVGLFLTDALFANLAA